MGGGRMEEEREELREGDRGVMEGGKEGRQGR